LLGVPVQVIAVIAPLHLFAQFWYHTQHIKKMGFLEKIIVTPSHHRVHHAINPEYLDKNLSQIFIFWDKWFGTFQEELPDKPCVYGITRPAATWNPIKINFQHIWLLAKDAWRTNNWADKVRVWYMPTGWRPKDVNEKYPVYKIDDVYNFQKYDPKSGKGLITWSWIQITVILLLISYFFGNIAKIGSPGMFIYGGFIFLYVYSFTELMDRNPYAVIWESLKNVLGIAIIIRQGDWFGADQLMPGISMIILAYFIIATVVSGYFSYRFVKEDIEVTPVLEQ